jgi:hypothetical protein
LLAEVAHLDVSGTEDGVTKWKSSDCSAQCQTVNAALGGDGQERRIFVIERAAQKAVRAGPRFGGLRVAPAASGQLMEYRQ